MARTEEIANPYLAARREWDERYGDLIKRAENWRKVCLVQAFTVLALVVGILLINYRTSTVPYVVALNKVGMAVPVVPASQVAVKDVRLQIASVGRWITDVRSVYTDPVAERHMIDEAYAMIGANSAASQVVTDYFRDNSPFERLSKGTVDVAIDSIVQQSAKTFDVLWSETNRDLYGQLLEKRNFRALVSIATQEIKDAQLAMVNPLGLFVTAASWGEVTTSDGGQNR